MLFAPCFVTQILCQAGQCDERVPCQKWFWLAEMPITASFSVQKYSCLLLNVTVRRRCHLVVGFSSHRPELALLGKLVQLSLHLGDAK